MKLFMLILSLLFLCNCGKKSSLSNISKSQIDSLAKEIKEQDVSYRKSFLKNELLDSLSQYKYSEIKRKYDSIKRYDSVTYYTLQKIVKSDTVGNYFNDADFLWFGDEKILTDEQYKKRASNILKEKHLK